jgi:hypothetical protein
LPPLTDMSSLRQSVMIEKELAYYQLKLIKRLVI